MYARFIFMYFLLYRSLPIMKCVVLDLRLLALQVSIVNNGFWIWSNRQVAINILGVKTTERRPCCWQIQSKIMDSFVNIAAVTLSPSVWIVTIYSVVDLGRRTFIKIRSRKSRGDTRTCCRDYDGVF